MLSGDEFDALEREARIVDKSNQVTVPLMNEKEWKKIMQEATG